MPDLITVDSEVIFCKNYASVGNPTIKKGTKAKVSNLIGSNISLYGDFPLVPADFLELYNPTASDAQVGGGHYKDLKIQPIDYITENKLDWFQGNMIKYATRHHNKNGAEDLMKVIHYAQLALEKQYSKEETK